MIILNFFNYNFVFFILRERKRALRKRDRGGERDRETHREREFQAGSMLSTETNAGLNPTILGS